MSDETIDTPATTIPVDVYIDKYVQLRDRKAAMVAAHKKQVEVLDNVLDRVELFLLKTMQDLGVESLKSGAGTAYQTTKTSATIADWPLYFDFLRAGEHWEGIDRKANKTFVDAWRTEHNDLPPGINWREEKTVNIRRT